MATVKGEKMSTHPVACEGGLNTRMGANAIAKPEFNGYAINLVNFEPGRGYRRISGFAELNSAAVGLEGSRKVVGVFVYNETILAAKLAASNLLLRTEEFDNAAFTKTNSTVGADAATAPFGGTIADKLIDDATLGVHTLTQGVSKAATALPYTFSVFAKAAELTYAKIQINDGAGNGAYCVFNLSSGALSGSVTGIGTAFTSLSASIQSFGSGWYRLVLNGTSNTGTTLNTVIGTYDGSTDSYSGASTGIYLYGAQLEQSSSVSFYTRVSSTAPTNSFYDLFLYQTTYWKRLTTDPRTISSTGRVRKLEHSFAGTPILILMDGSGYPIKWDGTTISAITTTNTYPKYASVFRNRVAYSGFSTVAQSHYISLTAPNTDDDFTAAAGAIDINAGDYVTGTKAFRENLYLLCRGRIKVMTGTSRDNFIVDDVTTSLGCDAPDSVVEVGGDVFFWGPDGLRPISATQRNGDVELSTITKHIKPSVDRLKTQYDTRNIVSVVIKDKSQVRLFFSDASTSDASARGLLGAVNSGLNSHEHGEDKARWEFATLLGINPTCADSGYISDDEYVLHGGFDGTVNKQENGNSFSGRQITAIYQTPHMDMGDAFIRKTVQRIKIYTELTGATTLYLGTYFDYKRGMTAQPVNKEISVTNVADLYGDVTSIYGDAGTVYGQEAVPLLESNLEGSGSVISLRLVSHGTDAPFTISGFALEFSAEGRH